MTKLYYSTGCPNSVRLLDIIKKIPSLRQSVQLLNVEVTPPNLMAGVEFVPTLVDRTGRQHVGSKAFEFLKPFEAEMELDGAPSGLGGLAYATLDGFGEAEYVTGHGDFTAPPP